jgi:hypothetical protein
VRRSRGNFREKGLTWSWAPLVRGAKFDARTTQSPANRGASPTRAGGRPSPPADALAMRTMPKKSSRNQRSRRFKVLSVKEAGRPADRARQVRDHRPHVPMPISNLSPPCRHVETGNAFALRRSFRNTLGAGNLGLRHLRQLLLAYMAYYGVDANHGPRAAWSV